MYIWRLWCVKGFVTLTGLSFKKKKLQQRESLFKFHFLLEITTDAEMLYIFSNFPSTLLNNW